MIYLYGSFPIRSFIIAHKTLSPVPQPCPPGTSLRRPDSFCYSQGLYPVHPQVRVLRHAGRKLAESQLPSRQRRPIGLSILQEAEHLQTVYVEPHIPFLYHAHVVHSPDIRHIRDGVASLGHQVESIALAQVAGMECPLVRLLPPEIGHMERIDVPVMVLGIFPCPGCQPSVKEILPRPSSGSEEQHAQPRLPKRREVPLNHHIGGKVIRTPEHIVGLLPLPVAAGVLQPHSALRKRDGRIPLQHEIFDIRLAGQRILIQKLSILKIDSFHGLSPFLVSPITLPYLFRIVKLQPAFFLIYLIFIILQLMKNIIHKHYIIHNTI